MKDGWRQLFQRGGRKKETLKGRHCYSFIYRVCPVSKVNSVIISTDEVSSSKAVVTLN